MVAASLLSFIRVMSSPSSVKAPGKIIFPEHRTLEACASHMFYHWAHWVIENIFHEAGNGGKIAIGGTNPPNQ
jgi:hypothetical protein